MHRFYIYAFIDGMNVLYVGKGTGKRLATQERRFGIKGKIVERMDDESYAYEREKYWISQLRPTENKTKGGGPLAFTEEAIPHGFSPEGLLRAAPYLAKLLVVYAINPAMTGAMGIVSAYVTAHGMDVVADAIRPYFAALKNNHLAFESNA